MARTQVSEVVEKIRRQVLSAYRCEIDVLDGLLADDEDDTTLTLEDCTSNDLRPGAVLSVGSETMRVRSVSTSDRTVTVVRAWGDSDAEQGDPGDIVWINPRFTGTDIYDHLVDEIGAWPTELFRVYGDTHSVAADAQTLELPVAYEGMYGLATPVRRNVPTITTSTAWPEVEVKFQRGQTSWDAATTTGLFLRFVRPIAVAWSAYVEAALPFDVSAITWDADLVDDVGLSETMLDLLTLGVKMRLMVDAEIDRSSRLVQDDPRRAEEVPPGAGLQSAEALRTLYTRRRNEEIARLRRLYPLRWS